MALMPGSEFELRFESHQIKIESIKTLNCLDWPKFDIKLYSDKKIYPQQGQGSLE